MQVSTLLRALLCVATLSGAVATAQAQVFNVQELGDEEMSCQALYDGTKDMDRLIQNAQQAQAQTQNQRSAGNSTGGLFGELARESGSSEGARVANLFGRLVASAGGSGNTAAPQEPAVTASQAQARKQHLSNIFRDKKCKVSTLRR